MGRVRCGAKEWRKVKREIEKCVGKCAAGVLTASVRPPDGCERSARSSALPLNKHILLP